MRHLDYERREMGRKTRRLVPPGTGLPLILDSARGNGPDDDDLIAAYSNRIAALRRPGHQGGRFFVGRSGKRRVVIGVDVNRNDESGNGEVIFHGEWGR